MVIAYITPSWIIVTQRRDEVSFDSLNHRKEDCKIYYLSFDRRVLSIRTENIYKINPVS